MAIESNQAIHKIKKQLKCQIFVFSIFIVEMYSYCYTISIFISLLTWHKQRDDSQRQHINADSSDTLFCGVICKLFSDFVTIFVFIAFIASTLNYCSHVLGPVVQN